MAEEPFVKKYVFRMVPKFSQAVRISLSGLIVRDFVDMKCISHQEVIERLAVSVTQSIIIVGLAYVSCPFRLLKHLSSQHHYDQYPLYCTCSFQGGTRLAAVCDMTSHYHL